MLVTSSSAKSISIISPEDEETAIGEITADGVNIYDGPVYNIAGQKLNAPQKHQVNIVNGKKEWVSLDATIPGGTGDKPTILESKGSTLVER